MINITSNTVEYTFINDIGLNLGEEIFVDETLLNQTTLKAIKNRAEQGKLLLSDSDLDLVISLIVENNGGSSTAESPLITHNCELSINNQITSISEDFFYALIPLNYDYAYITISGHKDSVDFIKIGICGDELNGLMRTEEVLEIINSMPNAVNTLNMSFSQKVPLTHLSNSGSGLFWDGLVGSLTNTTKVFNKTDKGKITTITTYEGGVDLDTNVLTRINPCIAILGQFSGDPITEGITIKLEKYVAEN